MGGGVLHGPESPQIGQFDGRNGPVEHDNQRRFLGRAVHIGRNSNHIRIPAGSLEVAGARGRICLNSLQAEHQDDEAGPL